MDEDLGSIQEGTFDTAAAATAGSYPAEWRLGPGQLAAYLDSRAFAVVSSARPDGRPHAAMTSYVRRGSTFWLPTVGGSVRERNLRHQPWLSLAVAEGDRNEHVATLLEGPAEIVAPEGVPADVRAAEPATGSAAGPW
jgi:hypothetical protein